LRRDAARLILGARLKKMPQNPLKTLGFGHRKIARRIFFEKII
jgi:hypothetical protein